MPLQATSGAASYDAFGGGVVAEPNYIESCFSTYLYTGTGASQTITNSIDLSTKGGLVWLKNRTGTYDHWLWDTARGAGYTLRSNLTNAQANIGTTEGVSFTTSGFSMGNNINWNGSSLTATSWTFRKQPKFFDIQTWTGTGANRTISHALGSVPACIIVKRTDTTGDWQVYHRSLANTEYLVLNSTAAKATGATRWNSTTPTSTVFSIGTDATVNASGGTYVAYIFAHDAGGFGLTGTDNVISCGSFTTDGSGYADVNLGYEPQWILMKASSASGAGENWITVDNMRGLVGTGTDYKAARLYPNLNNAEASVNTCQISSTGFKAFQSTSVTYIYIAIRRGPMKVPTSGTSVFSPVARTGTGAVASITAGFPVDLEISKTRPIANPSAWFDRLRGANLWLRPSGTGTEGETTGTGTLTGWDSNTGVTVGADASDGLINFGSRTYANWMFRRAPGFFDTVCYTGTGANATRPHNLGVVPEMMIVKKRSTTSNWAVYHSALGAAGWILLNTTAASSSGSDFWQSTTPTSTNFYTGTNGNVGDSGQTYVAYLFATLAGVSKVGSYTGNGSSQTIACGFTAGARFILIKRTDSTGDWYVWDTARGIIAGNDPYLLLNSTAAEVTSTDYIDTYSAGFEISSTAPAAINASGGTYIFLAIA
jgi:hypothetical protein